MLRQGYAIASSPLNVYGNNCDDVLSAETVMMVKEHFIEAYGVPKSRLVGVVQVVRNRSSPSPRITPGCSMELFLAAVSQTRHSLLSPQLQMRGC